MRYSHRLFISRLMILIMSLGSIQIAFAGSLDAEHSAKHCQFLSVQASESSALNSGEHDINYCQNHAVCVSHSNCASFLTSNLFELSAPVLMLAEDLASKVALSTRYPSLLKRPPKS
jgi:hypothetical protein